MMLMTYLCVLVLYWQVGTGVGTGVGVGGKAVRRTTETGDRQQEKASTLTARMDGSERLHQEFNHEQN